MSVRRPEPARSGVSTRVVALLTAAAFINAVDRGNLATAGPLILDQFGLTNAQLGVLLSAFFWTYAPGQLPAGLIAERLNPRWVLAAGLGIWGIATALTGLANGFMTILVLRLLLGVGESVMYPASFKILARDAREGQRGRANGFLSAAQFFGPAFGTFVGALVMVSLGWRFFFLMFGCASLLWLWPWLRTPAEPTPQVFRDAPAGPSTAMTLRRRELWGACIGQFCEAYALYLVLSWLPVYLVRARGFSVPMMAQFGAGVYVLSALAAIVSGWVSDRWLVAGARCSRVRMAAVLTGFIGVAVCMSACALAGPLGSLLAMVGCGISLGILLTAIFASVQTLAGAGAAARWMGVQNLCANVAGIAAPVITGLVVDRTGTFSAGFLIAASLAVLGIFAYGLIVREVEPVRWPTSGRSSGVAPAGEETIAADGHG